jgi:methyltransferase (TIGR00027 family)
MHPAQENIIQTGEPSGSALKVAVLRAAHQLLDDPIVFDDPLALSILGPQAEAALRRDPIQYNDRMRRGMRALLVVRSKLAEDALLQSVQAGVKQYVVLGAGLDTFAFRNADKDEGVHVYEVDHPSTQEWKKTMLNAAGIDIPDSMTFVAVDFEKDTLAEGLRRAGFCIDQPAYFSWLGVTMYLSTQAVLETLKFVASLPKGSAITFDYRVAPSLLNPRERMLGESIAKIIAEQGEPWKSHFEPDALHKALQDMGFRTTVDVGPEELNARYLAQRKDDFQTRGGFRIMCAKT